MLRGPFFSWTLCTTLLTEISVAFSTLTLLVGQQEGHPACKKWGNGRGRHCLIWMEWRPAGWSVSASVNLPLHHKVQKFSSGTSSPGWSWKKGHKTVVVVVTEISLCCHVNACLDIETICISLCHET